MDSREPELSEDATFAASYEVTGVLGEGSFGRVYRARQRSTGQDVAVKVMRARALAQARDAATPVERFKRELRVCARLAHPNIVRLIDSGETRGGTLYAVFEHVPGVTLKDVIAAEGRLSVRETTYLMAQVLDALSSAHALGIVHRDLTPTNVMVSSTGARRNALVLDFGLGGFARAAAAVLPRITAGHELLGTPCYAAPEQLRGEPPSPASDVYSWGLVLLECLTGEEPIAGASAQEVIHRQLGPEPVAIPRWLRDHPLGRVIEEATAKRPEKRPRDVRALLDALDGAVDGEAHRRAGRTSVIGERRRRRQLTITCCRFSAGAHGARELDVEEVDQLLREQHALLVKQASATGGAVAGVLADRVFIVHGYPQASESDARRAARAALTIVEESLHGQASSPTGAHIRANVHVGIHTGLVIVGDGDRGDAAGPEELRGLTPQLASRLADLAQPGEVLVSGDTHRLLRDEFSSEDAGSCASSELSRPVPVHRLGAVRAPGHTSPPDRTEAQVTPLVGRHTELARLLDGWSETVRGRPGATLVIGEAGMGKSRLLRELRRSVGEDAWLEWHCTAESQTSPLRPVIDALSSLDEGRATVAACLGVEAATELPLLSASLARPHGAAPGPGRTPELQKEMTLQALLRLVHAMAEKHPTVLAVENLHWADPTTLELLALVAHELQAARLRPARDGAGLYLVMTTRPELVPPWAAESVAFVPLQRLAPSEVAAMVSATVPGVGEAASLVDVVVERAEGVPLFVEEIARVVVGAHRGEGSEAGLPPRSITEGIPTSLRDLLTARLDRLSQPARETAQLAAALGREFRLEVLEALSTRDEGLLRDDLDELAQAGLVFQRRAARGDGYLFRHALLRDAAYEALTRPAREAIHRRIATVLREHFPELTQRRPDLVALHHEYGREIEQAVTAWQCAGMRSYRGAAYLEAISQLQRALTLLRGLGDSPAHRRQEVDLLVALGTALLATRGWAASEVEETFTRALEIAETAGTEPPLMVLYGLWGVLILRSERAPLEAFVPRIETLLGRSRERVVRHFSHSILGIAAFWRGDLHAARELLDQALGEYDEEDFYQSYDGGLYTHAFQFCTLGRLGDDARARALCDAAFGLAERRRDPYSLAVALAFGTLLANDRGDGASAMSYGERLMTLADEQKLYAFWAPGAVGYGAGLVLSGRSEEGIRFVRDGLARYRALGIMASYSFYQTYLARGYVAAGRDDEALQATDEGLALCRTLFARLHEPELHELRGEILLRRGDAAGAARELRRALADARRSGLVACATRSAALLGRLPHEDAVPAVT